MKFIQFLILSFIFLIMSYCAGIYYPTIWPDEVLFFSPSVNLVKTGMLSTTVLTGLIPGMETHTLWMPPAYFVTVSGIFYLFPETIFTARMFSSFIGVCSALVLLGIAKKFLFSQKSQFFLCLLIFTDLLFFKISHSARMESMCMFFGLCSFYFVILKTKEIRHWLHFFFAGIFLGLSFLSHPFGFVYSFPIILLLYLNKELLIKNLFLIFLGGIIPILGWAIYIIPNWDLFLLQFGAQFGRKKDLLGKFDTLYKFRIILSGFRYPIYKLIVLAIGIFPLAYIYKKIDEPFKFIIFYLFTIFSFLLLSSESWYVYHISIPLILLTVYLYERKVKFSSLNLYLSLLYNFIILALFFMSNFGSGNFRETTDKFFIEIDNAIGTRDGIYLQSLPDPYFYLTDKYPDKHILEFIPGELPIPPEKFLKTIEKLNAFVFYDENLINSHLKKYLEDNKSIFDKKEIQFNKPRFSEIDFRAIIYIRK